jgi:hypothetical protein
MRAVLPSWIVQSLLGITVALALSAGFGLTVAGETQINAPTPPAAVSGDRCSPGFTGSPETGCIDVNECAVGNGGCSRFARCQNLPGSRTCGSCPDGYAGDGYLGCFDVNDCPSGDCSSKIPVVPENDQPPVVTSTGDVTVAATSEAGADATFKATARDKVDGTIQAFCTPRAGSTFKVGKTTVTCWAYNTRGEIGRTTLIVTVTPAQ